jgi:hypothetical protein
MPVPPLTLLKEGILCRRKNVRTEWRIRSRIQQNVDGDVNVLFVCGHLMCYKNCDDYMLTSQRASESRGSLEI